MMEFILGFVLLIAVVLVSLGIAGMLLRLYVLIVNAFCKNAGVDSAIPGVSFGRAVGIAFIAGIASIIPNLIVQAIISAMFFGTNGSGSMRYASRSFVSELVPALGGLVVVMFITTLVYKGMFPTTYKLAASLTAVGVLVNLLILGIVLVPLFMFMAMG